MDAKTHWEKIYTTKGPDAVSWYRRHLETSLALIERAVGAHSAAIIDIGGGESTLVDDLLLRGYENITVLDISQTAIDVAKSRLGSAAAQVHWLVADVSEIELAPRAYDLSDVRLRRAQAAAIYSGADLQITKTLIATKLAGQERIARNNLSDPSAAEIISQSRAALDNAKTIAAIRGLEARAGLAYWSAWRDIPVTFPKVDQGRIPEHWRKFGTRVSPITRSPRCASNPPNAILNYLYAVLESESRLALTTIGLDPGLGFLHVDSRSRNSLACDLMETVRPEVDSYVLDWLKNRLFQKREFFEMRDGTCRLMAGICAQLSRTASTWTHAVGPWAEFVARTLWTTIRKRGTEPATPLTGDHRRAGRIGEHTRPVVTPPKPPRVCKSCGVACEHTYCASCGSVRTKEAFDEGRAVAQRPESLARRSATQKKHVRANQMWTPPREFAWLDRDTYIRDIQPRVINLPISALQSALGISEPYAAFIRAGARVPHRRHWQTLAQLVGISTAPEFSNLHSG